MCSIELLTTEGGGRVRKGVVRGRTFCCYSGEQTFIVLNVTGLCPLALLAKVCWRQGVTLGSEAGTAMRSAFLECGAEMKI